MTRPSRVRTPYSLTSCCIIVLLALLALSAPGLHAQQDAPVVVAPSDQAKVAGQQAARRQALLQDKEIIAHTRQDLDAQIADLPWNLEALKSGQLDKATLEQARVDVQSARLRQESAQTELSNADRRIQDLQKMIGELETREQLLKNPAKDAADGAPDRTAQLERTTQALTQQRTELDLETLNQANLRAQVEVAKLRLNLAEQWLSRVEHVYRVQQEQSRQDAQTELISRLQSELQTQQEQAATLRQRLDQERGALSVAARQRLETELHTVEEQINLLKMDEHLSETVNSLAWLDDLRKKTQADPDELQQGLEQLNGLREDLRRTDDLLQQRVSLYEQQRRIIEQRENLTGINRKLRDEEAQLIARLLDNLNSRAGQVQSLLTEANAVEAQLDYFYRERLHKDLFSRKSYPDNAEAWQQLLQGLVTVPRVLLYQVRLSIESAVKAMLDADILRWLGLLALEGALIWLALTAKRGLRRAIHRFDERDASDDNSSFLRQLIGNTLRLARANLLGAGSATALLPVLWLAQVPQPGLGILMTLALVWVGIKLPISLAWLLLASPRLPEAQRHPILYRQVFWTLVVGGLLVALVILAHLSDLPDTIVTAFDRLFMLYWFWTFLPVLRIRRLVMERLGVQYGARFWFVILRFSSLLLPLSLLGAAVLGLFGYLRLAWLVAGYLLIFITILVGWLLIRSLLNDLAVALKNYAVAHSGYGLLWTQDVIRPLHRIANLLLFLSAGMALFRAYGWTGDSALVVQIWAFLEQPLTTFGGASITPWGIMATLTILLVVIWLGQWSRAITYRWVFSKISDLGVRHSLSVFTQYAVVLIGLLITLRIIGIDLTTLAVFAGAVGVGIGLGMQNLANNFVSGLLLLVERPLRSGDIVKIGTHEGEVASIGMRALTVKTFDNQSVIIPNAEVTSNAFTNWTHHDRVLRVMLVVGISYDSDPHAARAVLQRVLGENEGVLSSPEPQVLLWEFSDSAVNFRVYYFVDIGRHSLLKIRDQLMFAIWDGFKNANISIPYPQRDLYIKAWPGSETDRNPLPPELPEPPLQSSLLRKLSNS